MRLKHALPLLALAALAACGRADDAGEAGPNGAIVPDSQIEGVGAPPDGPAPTVPVAGRRSGRRSAVRRSACSRRHAAIRAWSPESSTSGTPRPRQAAGLV